MSEVFFVPLKPHPYLHHCIHVLLATSSTLSKLTLYCQTGRRPDNAGEVEFTAFSLHGPDTSENRVNTIPQVIPTSTDYQRSVPTGMAASARSTFGPDPKSCYQTQVVHGRHFPAPARVPFKLLLPGPITLYRTIITFTLLPFSPSISLPRLVPLPSTLPSTVPPTRVYVMYQHSQPQAWSRTRPPRQDQCCHTLDFPTQEFYAFPELRRESRPHIAPAQPRRGDDDNDADGATTMTRQRGDGDNADNDDEGDPHDSSPEDSNPSDDSPDDDNSTDNSPDDDCDNDGGGDDNTGQRTH
ncbi:hypothetical protein EDB83DRAFT_2556259 [Lactarius deliciosus]|nr:hypothetical protein EDB83DRAFT_2556259 [Lactarius deliciosus]